ncbi:MAG: hypothetical protein ABW137_34710 [Mycobacterium sp.]
MKARLVMAGVLAASAVLAGCQSTVDGNPQGSAGSPTEPSFPTSRPSVSTPTTTSPAPPPATPTAAPPAAEALPPDKGYVFVVTKSGKTRCQISAAEVGCEADFINAPTVNGEPANGVNVSAEGQVTWLVGNIGDIPVVPIDYRTYSAVGWTILATEEGTRFTNDQTGHGMFVAIEKVEPF